MMCFRENQTASPILPWTHSLPELGRAALACVRVPETDKANLWWHASAADVRAALSLYIQGLEKFL